MLIGFRPVGFAALRCPDTFSLIVVTNATHSLHLAVVDVEGPATLTLNGTVRERLYELCLKAGKGHRKMDDHEYQITRVSGGDIAAA